MMVRKIMLSAAALTAALAASGAANAEDYRFTLTGDYSAVWVLSSDPTPALSLTGIGFQVNNVPGTFQGVANPFADVLFYASDYDGGLEIDDPSAGGVAKLITSGPQLYSGGEDTPHFTLGTFALTQYQGAGTYSLNIAAVPEPAAWAMMIAGFGLVGSALRRRDRAAPLLAT